MSKQTKQIPRRRFLRTTASAAGAGVLAPTIIPSSALGLDGAVAPSERIVVGGIGIGRRGGYDLGCFLQGLAGPSIPDDGLVPPAGEALYYVTTAVNCAGESTLGSGRTASAPCP